MFESFTVDDKNTARKHAEVLRRYCYVSRELELTRHKGVKIIGLDILKNEKSYTQTMRVLRSRNGEFSRGNFGFFAAKIELEMLALLATWLVSVLVFNTENDRAMPEAVVEYFQSLFVVVVDLVQSIVFYIIKLFRCFLQFHIVSGRNIIVGVALREFLCSGFWDRLGV